MVANVFVYVTVSATGHSRAVRSCRARSKAVITRPRARDSGRSAAGCQQRRRTPQRACAAESQLRVQRRSTAACENHARSTRREVMVPFKCDVHGWMNAWVASSTIRLYFVTGSDGTFSQRPARDLYDRGVARAGYETQMVTIGAKKPGTSRSRSRVGRALSRFARIVATMPRLRRPRCGFHDRPVFAGEASA